MAMMSYALWRYHQRADAIRRKAQAYDDRVGPVRGSCSLSLCLPLFRPVLLGSDRSAHARWLFARWPPDCPLRRPYRSVLPLLLSLPAWLKRCPCRSQPPSRPTSSSSSSTAIDRSPSFVSTSPRIHPPLSRLTSSQSLPPFSSRPSWISPSSAPFSLLQAAAMDGGRPSSSTPPPSILALTPSPRARLYDYEPAIPPLPHLHRSTCSIQMHRGEWSPGASEGSPDLPFSIGRERDLVHASLDSKERLAQLLVWRAGEHASQVSLQKSRRTVQASELRFVPFLSRTTTLSLSPPPSLARQWTTSTRSTLSSRRSTTTSARW